MDSASAGAGKRSHEPLAGGTQAVSLAGSERGSEAAQESPPGEIAHVAEAQRAADAVARVVQTVWRMVSPNGCAWHEEQTHESLTPFLIEEAAEFIDAVERRLPAEELESELGDVLYQVVFHAAIAERDAEGYSLAEVADHLNTKLIARHPHVFGDRGYMSVDELHAEWERLKEDAAGEERGSRGALEGIPVGMPTLARAAKVVERLKRAGLVQLGAGEGTPEDPLATAIGPDERALAEVGIGDAMLALVMRANSAGVDPDRALRLAVDRLAARVMHSELHGED
ncbi:Nucleoside triphosphate pyrophosphohydrolase MazG [Leucobacter sp. 7(1)]|uniref:MazG nucleotide pyrophosphohydrolase domain-containing protein n=1 Tax=Leucobacter sp. 7(1) TaxID=1255613 RepID=UPI00097EC25F|nr:MazG nucleotide pyrophosphohydrolase domain-containing protein [Leucobacter sp. 7(1)]SJN12732.1 Nucleoside triphosphate pyrophosphohydrolase MazG [Leucobacter sp. 7(1)]